MSIFVDLDNWYWIGNGDATQVYSSASMSFVPVSDTTYQAWLATGLTPEEITGTKLTNLLRPKTYLNDTDTQDLLQRLRSATPAQLKTYVDTNVTNLASAKILLAKILLVVGLLLRGVP